MLTLQERNDLIVSHMSLAERIASSQFKKIPFCVQWDEVKSAAYMGLVDAASKYDGDKPFEIYSSYRIYGEIKDYLRGLAWGTRSNRVKAKSWDESFDYACEPEPENFDDVFDDLTKPLSPLVKKVLRMYYAEDMTMKQIAEVVELSSTRIYQIIQSGLQKLRDANIDVA